MTVALGSVVAEQLRQMDKWGVQNHTDDRWALILLEEVGEVAEAILSLDGDAMRAELVQVAAVAVTWIECFDRRHGGLPR